jgi:ribonuclease P protein component
VKRAQRLRRAADFRRTRDLAGRGQAHPLLVLFTAPNGLGDFRVGITVSSRVGKAVVRNRARRRLREALRKQLEGVPPAGRDLVAVARPAIAAASWVAIDQAVGEVLRRAGIRPAPDATNMTPAYV